MIAERGQHHVEGLGLGGRAGGEAVDRTTIKDPPLPERGQSITSQDVFSGAGEDTAPEDAGRAPITLKDLGGWEANLDRVPMKTPPERTDPLERIRDRFLPTWLNVEKSVFDTIRFYERLRNPAEGFLPRKAPGMWEGVEFLRR